MPMGDNIREEEQAKVDGLRAVNRMLREQNRVLAQALRIAIFLEGPENVLHEYELWCELIDNGLKEKFNEWYGERVLAALTATSQEGQHGSR